MEWLGGAKPDPNAKFPVLISYAYLRQAKPEDIDFLMKNPKIELIIDSGAFTALNAGKEIDLREYMDFLKQYQSRLFGYFALDKLGDPATTEKNFEIMMSQGLKPIPIHVRGDDRKRMDYLFQHSDWVGCGGFRRPQRGPAPKTYIMEKMRWASGRNVHWLGYTTSAMLKTFKPYSCDCSSWHMPLKYGTMRLYFGGGVWGSKAYRYTDFKSPEIPARILNVVEKCGFTAKQLRDPTYWRSHRKEDPDDRRYLSMNVSLYSWVKYIKDFRAKVGTRIFLAIGTDMGHARNAYRWIDKLDTSGAQPYVAI